MDITMQDIKEWREQIDKAFESERFKKENQVIVLDEDTVYFRGPQIYGSCSRELWNKLLMKEANKLSK